MARVFFLAVVALGSIVIRESEESYTAGASTGATGYSCPTLFNYYGDVYDCTRFYRCVWGQAYAFSCPAGTRWSQNILTCDHAYNVHCANEPGSLVVPKGRTEIGHHSGGSAGGSNYGPRQYYDLGTQFFDGYSSQRQINGYQSKPSYEFAQPTYGPYEYEQPTYEFVQPSSRENYGDYGNPWTNYGDYGNPWTNWRGNSYRVSGPTSSFRAGYWKK